MKEIRIDQNGKLVTYVRYEPIYENEFILLQKKINSISKSMITTHVKKMSIEAFMQSVYDFEKQNAYTYSVKSKNRTIYASKITLLLPQVVDDRSKKLKLVKAYIRKILVDMKFLYLNYFAYEYTKGKGTYIDIIIIEREYLDKRLPKRYSRDYSDKKKKGDIIKDTEGNVIEEYILFGSKLRLFNEGSFHRLVQRCKESLVSAYKNITKSKLIQNLRFKRVVANKYTCRYKRRSIMMINQFKDYIECYINELYVPLVIEREHISYDDQYLNYKIRLLVEIFRKFSSYFEFNSFQQHRINYKFVPYPEIEETIDKMKLQFHLDFEKLIQKL